MAEPGPSHHGISGVDVDPDALDGASEAEVVHLEVPAGAASRLDAFLVDALGERQVTRSAITRLIAAGQVTIRDIVAGKPGVKVRAGDVVEVEFFPPTPSDLLPEDIPLSITYEDEHLLILDKPAGMVVHPAPGHYRGTLVNALLHHCQTLGQGRDASPGAQVRPGIVHRLDKDTSGLMVASKTDLAHVALSAMFAQKTIRREYLAYCAPVPRVDHAVIQTLYGRHPADRKRFTGKVSQGKHAITEFWVEERFALPAALVRCRLQTGRTHQIRVHMCEFGAPLLGDSMYQGIPRLPALRELAEALGRQALHSSVLSFVHPITGVVIDAHAPLPEDLQRLHAALAA